MLTPKCRLCLHVNPTEVERCENCGESLSTSWDVSTDQIRSLVAQGSIIEAVKLYRQQTGVGPAEAKNAVEALTQIPAESADGLKTPSQNSNESEDQALPSEVLSLLNKGEWISAIKLYRNQTGAGLKESKEAVDALAEKYGIKARRVRGPMMNLSALVVLLLLGSAILVSTGVIHLLFR